MREPGPGDPDGSGTATLRLNPGLEQVCFELSVSNIALPATGAHIHVGEVDEFGDVVAPLIHRMKTAPPADASAQTAS